MNTITNETDKKLMIAETYYHAMFEKNFDVMETCLHPDVHFLGPLAENYLEKKQSLMQQRN